MMFSNKINTTLFLQKIDSYIAIAIFDFSTAIKKSTSLKIP